MVQIVSGVTNAGEIRFIGQVASGLQPDLHCPVCQSLLVAKKGEIKDWHFAHENGNQSPRCIVGARNLLRRAVKQHIAAVGKIPAPSAYEYASTHYGTNVFAKVTPAIKSVLAWCADDDSTTHLADIALADDTLGQIHLSLSGDPLPRIESNRRCLLSIRVDEAAFLQLTAADDMAAGVMPKATAKWIFLPDTLQQIQDVRRAAVAQAEERALRSAADAAVAAQGRGAPSAPVALARSTHQIHTHPVALPQPSWKDDTRLHWAAELKTHASIFCMRMQDGSDWFIYETETGIHKFKPWPDLFDGWDEFFPPKIGAADERMGCYIVKDFGMFFMTIRSYINGMMNTSNPTDVVNIFEGFAKNDG